jgi:hypothetical protein
MFENYLEILGILNSTGELIDSIKANIGFREGKFMIDPKDWRYLIEVETNRKVKRNISVKSLAKNSPFAEDLVIYEYLYSWLSQYVHPDIFTMPAYVGKEGFDYFKNNFGFETIFFSTYVNALILQTILLVEDLDDLSRRDIEVYLQSTIPTLITVISDIKENNPEIPDELTSRLKRVAPSASD